MPLWKLNPAQIVGGHGYTRAAVGVNPDPPTCFKLHDATGGTTVRRLLELKPVEVHDFDPGGYKVVHELILTILTGVDFGQCP